MTHDSYFSCIEDGVATRLRGEWLEHGTEISFSFDSDLSNEHAMKASKLLTQSFKELFVPEDAHREFTIDNHEGRITIKLYVENRKYLIGGVTPANRGSSTRL
jgi:hypothetical protein